METTAPLPFLFPTKHSLLLSVREEPIGLGTQLVSPVGLFLTCFALQSKTKLEFNCGQTEIIHITVPENLIF